MHSLKIRLLSLTVHSQSWLVHNSESWTVAVILGCEPESVVMTAAVWFLLASVSWFPWVLSGSTFDATWASLVLTSAWEECFSQKDVKRTAWVEGLLKDTALRLETWAFHASPELFCHQHNWLKMQSSIKTRHRLKLFDILKSWLEYSYVQ